MPLNKLGTVFEAWGVGLSGGVGRQRDIYGAREEGMVGCDERQQRLNILVTLRRAQTM